MNPDDLLTEYREGLLTGERTTDPLGYMNHLLECQETNRRLNQKESNDVNKSKSRNNS